MIRPKKESEIRSIKLWHDDESWRVVFIPAYASDFKILDLGEQDTLILTNDTKIYYLKDIVGGFWDSFGATEFPEEFWEKLWRWVETFYANFGTKETPFVLSRGWLSDKITFLERREGSGTFSAGIFTTTNNTTLAILKLSDHLKLVGLEDRHDDIVAWCYTGVKPEPF